MSNKIRVIGPAFRSEGIGAVLFSDVIVIDERKSLDGWKLRGLFPYALSVECTLMEQSSASADGISINTDLWLGIEKDGTLNSNGDTGGIYHFDIYVILPLTVDPRYYEFPGLKFRE